MISYRTREIPIIVFFLVINSMGCSTNNEFTEFKRVIKPAITLINEIKNIPIEKEKYPNGRVEISTRKITQFVERKDSEVSKVINDIDEFIKRNKESRWIDDAYVFKGIVCLFTSTKEKPLVEQAINIYKKIIYDFPNLQFEDWSKKIVTENMKFLIIPNPAEISHMEHLKVEDRIKVYFSRALILEYLKSKNIGGAKKELESLSRLFDVNNQNIIELRQYIEEYESGMVE